ncbi:MAG TPA: HAMP domain-containing sensor histidine kinase, partial [Xanthomonadales bacterium]|nr:HAMP domain-containing sensor histidine kinase [Xanthomonadales bacterium]
MLEQGLASRSLGSADIALLRHELRTPLTGMLGLAEMLAAIELPGKATYWLATLQACGQQMAGLIDRALQPQFQQALVGQHSFADGLQLAETLLAAHWPAAQANGARLMLAFHPEALVLWCIDVVALRQALDNLLANAIRFSRNGTVLLEIRLVRLPGLEGDRLEIAVENSAPGSAGHVSRLRDQSEYADRSYRLSSHGHGLGVVEQVCRQLGGLLRRRPGPTGMTRYSLVLDSAISLGRTLPRPFRPALL